MRPTFKIQTLFLLLAAFLLLHACAKQGYPSGGPKDETPPVVLGTTPANGTLNFDAKVFSIAFDEYVQVKDADNNILVSPPMKQKPEYGTKGKSLVVKIKDTLRANTTYLFQFKGGIVDFNESNPLASFEYVFSTGSAIDSMTIRGQVLDAFTGQPSKETVSVAAYLKLEKSDTLAQLDSLEKLDSLEILALLDSLAPLEIPAPPSADSVVAKEHPLYITRCDPEGHFQLNHMRPGCYLLIAFLDGDKNLRLGNGEAVAFLDTLVASQKMPPAPDTTAIDSTTLDSTTLDSAALETAILDSLASAQDSLSTTPAVPTVKPVTLYLSLFKQEQQRVTKSDFKKKGLVEISTLLSLTDSMTLFPLGSAPSDTTLYFKANRSRDTLTVWPAMKDCDSLTLVIADHQLSDTLRLQYRSKATPGRSALSKQLTPSSMKSLVGGSHPYYDTLWIAFETPVLALAVPDSVADSAVKVFCLTDSTTSHCAIRCHPDLYPTGSSRARLDFNGKQGCKYRFTVPQGLFKNIYGQVNADSLSFTTEFTKAENYGNIILTLTHRPAATEDTLTVTTDTLAAPADSALAVQDTVVAPVKTLVPLLIQLTNEKGDLLRQFVVTHDQKLTFSYLKGGKYNLRAVLDNDGDGKWTPGDYWQQRQPEPVIYFNKTLELRENWDMEEKWEIAR